MHCRSESTTSDTTNNTISATGASNPLKMNEFCRLVLEFIYILTLFWSIQPPDEPFGVGGDAALFEDKANQILVPGNSASAKLLIMCR